MKIGSITFPIFDEVEILKIKQEFINSEFDLIYLFIESKNLNTIPPLTDILPEPIDVKISYTKSIQINLALNKDIELYNGGATNKLFELAKLSGQYSRFKTEPKFSYLFEKFYEEWVNNSVKGLLADKIFIYKEFDSIKGFATIKKGDGIGRIGLIAVDKTLQGKGIGKQLLSEAEKWFNHNKINCCEVVTQASNEQACRFYESAGYKIGRVQFVYHLKKEN